MKLKKIQGMRGGVRISLVKKNEFFFFQKDGRKGTKTGTVQYVSGLPYLPLPTLRATPKEFY